MWNTSTHKHTCMYCTNSHVATPVHTRRLCHAATARQLHGKASGLCTRTCAVVRWRPAPSQESRVLHSSGKNPGGGRTEVSLRNELGALPPPPPLLSFQIQLPEQDAEHQRCLATRHRTINLIVNRSSLSSRKESTSNNIPNQTARTEINHRNNKPTRRKKLGVDWTDP